VIALPVRWSAGKWTVIDVAYGVIIKGGWGLKVSLGINVAQLLLWWWLRQASNRAIGREHRRLPELEQAIDSRRSSSTPKD